MSQENEDFYNEIPDLYEEEIIEEKPKRKRTPKQREAGLKNLELARQKRKSLVDKKKQEPQYDEYILDERDNQLGRRNYKREMDYYNKYNDDYSDSDYSDDDDDPVYEIRPTKSKSKGISHSRDKPKMSKKQQKEEDKLARIENILMDLVKAQKVSKKPKKVVRNTVIQVPKSAPAELKSGGSLDRLIKLF
jgi:hypothetical protein